jgi:hypothetical protein
MCTKSLSCLGLLHVCIPGDGPLCLASKLLHLRQIVQLPSFDPFPIPSMILVVTDPSHYTLGFINFY